MRVALHQPNFAPWLPFFYKMSIVDKFVILTHCQYEKGGFQNRYKTITGKWVTMPIEHGLHLISEKKYKNGVPLLQHNVELIEWIARTLDIKTNIVRDVYTNSVGTQRVIDNLDYHGATTYVTNPEAKEKYLDESALLASGVEVEYCVVPRHLQIGIWDAFEAYGIEGIKKQLKRARSLKVGKS